MINIKSILASLIQKEGINIAQLANVTGVKPTVIHRILNGETLNPKIETVYSLADYFKVSINALIGKENINSIRAPLIPFEKLIDFRQGNFVEEKYQVISEDNSENNYIATTVIDTTMLPLYRPNTTIVLDRKKTAVDRDFVVIYIKDKNTCMFRQFLLNSGEHYLKPLNQDFPVLHLVSQFEIIGVVTETYFKL